MLYDEFQREIRPLPDTIVIYVGTTFYDIFGDDALRAETVLERKAGRIAWRGQEIPHLQNIVYPLQRDAQKLTKAGCRVWLCWRVAGIYHYEPFQAEDRNRPPRVDRRPVPPPGYTLVKGKLEKCPVCGRSHERWWGPDDATVFQDERAQAKYRQVEEDRDDWRWMYQFLAGFSGHEYAHRLMGSAPVWHDRQYFIDGASLVSHWSRYAVGGCACGARFWHDWVSPMRYYVQIPARTQPRRQKAKQPDARPAEVGAQLALF